MKRIPSWIAYWFTSTIGTYQTRLMQKSDISVLTFAEASQAPDTNILWSGETAKLITSPVWPLNAVVCWPVSISHKALQTTQTSQLLSNVVPSTKPSTKPSGDTLCMLYPQIIWKQNLHFFQLAQFKVIGHNIFQVWEITTKPLRNANFARRLKHKKGCGILAYNSEN